MISKTLAGSVLRNYPSSPVSSYRLCPLLDLRGKDTGCVKTKSQAKVKGGTGVTGGK